MKDDPLGQGYADQVREQLGKHTLWLNASNFEDMVTASWDGYAQQQTSINRVSDFLPDLDTWRAMCAAALAVVEWRMSGRVKP